MDLNGTMNSWFCNVQLSPVFTQKSTSQAGGVPHEACGDFLCGLPRWDVDAGSGCFPRCDVWYWQEVCFPWFFHGNLQVLGRGIFGLKTWK